MNWKRPHIKILRLSSREQPDLLGAKMAILRQWFPGLRVDNIEPDRHWPYSSGTIEDRFASLNLTLADPTFNVLWCARGGYGAADLLGRVDFEALKATPMRLIVGFSDVSALHCAFYTQLGWPGLHGPMPATTLWNDAGQDVAELKRILAGDFKGSVPLSSDGKAEINGRLFGGCFSVLTNLIGTPYFPKSLAGHIVFLEDTGESPGRLMRFLNQWIYAGALDGVKAIVLGDFRECGDPEKYQAHICDQFRQRTNVPIIAKAQFGHCSPNYPIMVGAQASIRAGELSWQYEPQGEGLWS